jgi:hypothetical protein
MPTLAFILIEALAIRAVSDTPPRIAFPPIR